MSVVLDATWELVNAFTKDSKWVSLKADAIEKPELLAEFKSISLPVEHLPDCITDETDLCIFELLASSINYCYWYGSSEVRLNGCGSPAMYAALGRNYATNKPMYRVIDDLCKEMAMLRFPMIEQRVMHLKQLLNCRSISRNLLSVESLSMAFDAVIQYCAGLANDMFVKRASLFFMQLVRRLQFSDRKIECPTIEKWSKDLSILPCPSDYQIPKMLEHYGIIEYHPKIKQMIQDDVPFIPHSKMECEIRAFTILAVKKLSEASGVPAHMIDYYFWLNRKECKNKFHLCETTDY
jgi:hypothetical protein